MSIARGVKGKTAGGSSHHSTGAPFHVSTSLSMSSMLGLNNGPLNFSTHRDGMSSSGSDLMLKSIVMAVVWMVCAFAQRLSSDPTSPVESLVPVCILAWAYLQEYDSFECTRPTFLLDTFIGAVIAYILFDGVLAETLMVFALIGLAYVWLNPRNPILVIGWMSAQLCHFLVQGIPTPVAPRHYIWSLVTSFSLGFCFAYITRKRGMWVQPRTKLYSAMYNLGAKLAQPDNTILQVLKLSITMLIYPLTTIVELLGGFRWMIGLVAWYTCVRVEWNTGVSIGSILLFWSILVQLFTAEALSASMKHAAVRAAASTSSPTVDPAASLGGIFNRSSFLYIAAVVVGDILVYLSVPSETLSFIANTVITAFIVLYFAAPRVRPTLKAQRSVLEFAPPRPRSSPVALPILYFVVLVLLDSRIQFDKRLISATLLTTPSVPSHQPSMLFMDPNSPIPEVVRTVLHCNAIGHGILILTMMLASSTARDGRTSRRLSLLQQAVTPPLTLMEAIAVEQLREDVEPRVFAQAMRVVGVDLSMHIGAKHNLHSEAARLQAEMHAAKAKAEEKLVEEQDDEDDALPANVTPSSSSGSMTPQVHQTTETEAAPEGKENDSVPLPQIPKQASREVMPTTETKSDHKALEAERARKKAEKKRLQHEQRQRELAALHEKQLREQALKAQLEEERVQRQRKAEEEERVRRAEHEERERIRLVAERAETEKAERLRQKELQRQKELDKERRDAERREQEKLQAEAKRREEAEAEERSRREKEAAEAREAAEKRAQAEKKKAEKERLEKEREKEKDQKLAVPRSRVEAKQEKETSKANRKDNKETPVAKEKDTSAQQPKKDKKRAKSPAKATPEPKVTPKPVPPASADDDDSPIAKLLTKLGKNAPSNAKPETKPLSTTARLIGDEKTDAEAMEQSKKSTTLPFPDGDEPGDAMWTVVNKNISDMLDDEDFSLTKHETTSSQGAPRTPQHSSLAPEMPTAPPPNVDPASLVPPGTTIQQLPSPTSTIQAGEYYQGPNGEVYYAMPSGAVPQTFSSSSYPQVFDQQPATNGASAYAAPSDASQQQYVYYVVQGSAGQPSYYPVATHQDPSSYPQYVAYPSPTGPTTGYYQGPDGQYYTLQQ